MAAPPTSSPVAAGDTSSSQTIGNGVSEDARRSESYERSLTPPAAPREPPEYTVGEKALCYHGPLIYEAKILQMSHFDKPAPLTALTGWHYFVHYKGWKRTWDEWVNQSRLMKLNEENLAYSKMLTEPAQPPAGSSKAAGGGGGGATASSGGGGSKAAGGAGAGGASTKTAGGKKDTRGTKRGRDEDDLARKTEMKLIIPEILKQILVNDWENVTRHGQLVDVPAKPSVVDILSNFSKHIMEMNPRPAHLKDPEKNLAAVTWGLQTYFDKSLGLNLLYRFERPQYAQVWNRFCSGDPTAAENMKMSSIYGAEHLLRMLVSLPAMVAQSPLDKASTETIRDYANELIQYMLHERDNIFQQDYSPTGPMYSNVARS